EGERPTLPAQRVLDRDSRGVADPEIQQLQGTAEPDRQGTCAVVSILRPNRLEVPPHHVRHGAVRLDFAGTQQDGPTTQVLNRCQVVTDKEDGAAVSGETPHLAQALPLE